MLQVENVSENQANDVMLWHLSEYSEADKSHVMDKSHVVFDQKQLRRGSSTINRSSLSGKKEKRRGILDVENYVMSICQDNIASQKTNDKEGDSDRISNYDNVAMEPLLCQNPDVQKHRESNQSDNISGVQDDGDSCYDSSHRSSFSSSTASLKSSVCATSSLGNENKAKLKYSCQTIEKILHTKQRIRRMLHASEFDSQEDDQVQEKLNSTNKRARSSKRHNYVTISFNRNRKSVLKSSIMSPNGNKPLYENVVLENRHSVEKIIVSPNLDSKLSRSDSGCCLDSDIHENSNRTEENFKTSTDLNEDEIAEVFPCVEKNLWSTLRRNTKRKSSLFKRNGHSKSNYSFIYPETNRETIEITSPVNLSHVSKKSESPFKGCFSPPVVPSLFKDPPSPFTSNKTPSPMSRGFSLIRSKSKRSSSKHQRGHRKSLPAEISLDVTGGGLYTNSSPTSKYECNGDSITSKKDYNNIEDMVMTSIQSSHSACAEASCGCESKTSDEKPSKRRSVKSRIFSSLVRKKSSYEVEKNTAKNKTFLEKNKMNKQFSRSSPQLSSLLIDCDKQLQSRNRL